MIRKEYSFQSAPRCHAHSKRSKLPCRNPAVRGKKVCRNHGAYAGAPKDNVNALKHGKYTQEAISRRMEYRELMRQVRDLLEQV